MDGRINCVKSAGARGVVGEANGEGRVAGLIISGGICIGCGKRGVEHG